MVKRVGMARVNYYMRPDVLSAVIYRETEIYQDCHAIESFQRAVLPPRPVKIISIFARVERRCYAASRKERRDSSVRPYSIKSAAGAVPSARRRTIRRRMKKIRVSSGVLK